jgi:purine-binding chemotaxis protein CheW
VADKNDIATEVDTDQGGVCVYADQIVAFYLGEQRYALPIERVQEIQQIVAFTSVPESRQSVVGMINLRGDVIPAVDVRRLVGLPAQDYSLETPMIICRHEGQLVALLVDEVQDVLGLPVGCVQEAPALNALSSKMIGVARLDDGLAYLLDLDKLLGGA